MQPAADEPVNCVLGIGADGTSVSNNTKFDGYYVWALNGSLELRDIFPVVISASRVSSRRIGKAISRDLDRVCTKGFLADSNGSLKRMNVFLGLILGDNPGVCRFM